MKRAFGLCLVVCLLSTFSPKIFAQNVPADDATQIVNTVNFIASPSAPGPNTRVHLVIEAFGIDLESSVETWSVGGHKVQSGTGLTSLDFSTGNLGSSNTVSVSINTGNTVITRTIDFSPSSVDLMWQGNTYTPSFYRGRSLWGLQSRVTFLAVPHVVGVSGAELTSSNLIYRWTKDGEVFGSQSGAGKNSLTISDTILSLPITVSVDVMTDSNTVVGTASLTLTPEPAQILVYEDNPLYGIIFGNAIGEQTKMRDKEVSFVALPLGMSPISRLSPNLLYTWSTNTGSNSTSANKATYRAPDNTNGSTQVHVEVANKTMTLQGASKDFLVQFGGETNI